MKPQSLLRKLFPQTESVIGAGNAFDFASIHKTRVHPSRKKPERICNEEARCVVCCGHDEDDIKEALKGSDFGMVLGGGVTYPVSNYSLFGELRYGFGFSDIAKSESSELKTKGFQIMVGATIPLGGKSAEEKNTFGSKPSNLVPKAEVVETPAPEVKTAAVQQPPVEKSAETPAKTSPTPTTKKATTAKKAVKKSN